MKRDFSRNRIAFKVVRGRFYSLLMNDPYFPTCNKIPRNINTFPIFFKATAIRSDQKSKDWFIVITDRERLGTIPLILSADSYYRDYTSIHSF